jgi:mannose-1-phosphate guanylyltransferase
MRGLLLAAGLGTRLKPLTDTIPKCLVLIHGQPLLNIWLQRLSAAGAGPFLINTHYLASKVADFVQSSPYSAVVSLVNEPELLGTAGTLIENLSFFGDGDGMLLHADNYCLADLSAFQEAHRNRPAHCLMTMMTFRTQTPSSCGIIELDQHGVVVGFHEKVSNPPGNLANGAIYILSGELMQWLRTLTPRPKDFSTEIIGRLKGRIYTYETAAVFLDIGTPQSYALANSTSITNFFPELRSVSSQPDD